MIHFGGDLTEQRLGAHEEAALVKHDTEMSGASEWRRDMLPEQELTQPSTLNLST